MRNVLKRMKKTIFQFFFLERTKFLGLKIFCEPDLETLTSASREPVGLSFKLKSPVV